MGRKKKIDKYEPLSIKLDSVTEEDLNKLRKNNEFKEIIYEEVIKVFEFTSKHNLPKSTLFIIPNLDLTVNVVKKNYKPIIDNILKYYTEKEDYNKCIELTKLKEKL